MKNKLLIVLASALTMGAVSSTHAQAPAPAAAAPSYTITATGTLVSQYMFRGQRLGGLSAQPAIEYGSGNLGIGIWSNFPIKDEVPDTSDPEFDLYAYYNVALSDTATFVPGFTYYYYPKAPTDLGFYRGTFEPSLAFNLTVGGVKLTPKLYYDFTLKGPTYEFTGFYAVPLKDLGTELDFTATIGTYDVSEFANTPPPATKARGDYWLVGVALPFQINPSSKLTVGWAYTKGRDATLKTGSGPEVDNSLAVGRGVITVSFSATF